MPGKEIKLIGKTIHPDGYYTASSISTSHELASESTEAAATVPIKRPHIKLWFRLDKGIFIGPEQREKLIREEEEQELQAAKEEIPTPGFVLLVKESVVEEATTTTDDYSSSSSTFQSKLDATKRKMHDSYQQLANAKKQRRIQVIDPRDLPPPPTQSSSKGKGGVIAARKKMIISTTTNRTNTRSNNNLFNGGVRSRLVKPTSIF